jgi:uncharacterized protein YutE (UPF0331/DUF86 family)
LVDKTLILRKLAELEEYLEQIREFSAVSEEKYSGDWKTRRIVERTLQIMIELCIDIAGHIISDRKLRVPLSYADTFKSLAEAGLITPDTLDIMGKMAKFRNIVVHQYESVDTAIVIMILRKHLDDFLVFRDAVVKMVNGHPIRGAKSECDPHK